MSLPRPVVKALHEDIIKALDEVAKKHGFTSIHKSLRFDDVRVTGRMEFIKQGAETEVVNRLGVQNGLDFKVGEAVTVGHKSFTVKGFTPRGKVIIENAKGKQYVAHSYQLKRPNAATGSVGSLSDRDLLSMIPRFIPGLNRNATKSVLDDWKWKSLGNDNANRTGVPMPKTEAEVRERCEKCLSEERESFSKGPLAAKTDADVIQLLNESADETYWEARVS